MARKLQLRDDAYRALAAAKRPGESLSDTVNRLAAHQKDLGRLLHLSPPLKGYDAHRARERTRRADLRRWRAMGLLPQASRRRRA